jgi:hypothetical protein
MWERKGNIFDKHHAQVPVVDIHNDSYWRIYYSKRIDNKSHPFYIDVEVGNPSNILNESKSPILELGELGKFDVAGVMPTEIITIKNKKYLYYIGWTNRLDVPYHNTLGLAISNDNGNTWNKFSDGPIFGTSYREPGYVGTISVIKKNKLFYGYYLSCREWKIIDAKTEPIYDIKYATSTNGIDWLPAGTAVKLGNGEGGISKASLLKIKNVYYMWFSVRMENDYRNNPQNSYRIRCAISYNLENWERFDAGGLDIDTYSKWENEMVEYPHVITYRKKLFMFYNGNGFGKTGIGYATAKT